MKNLTIEPFKGYGDIKFGMSIEDIVNIFGEPSNNEELESIIEENEELIAEHWNNFFNRNK